MGCLSHKEGQNEYLFVCIFGTQIDDIFNEFLPIKILFFRNIHIVIILIKRPTREANQN